MPSPISSRLTGFSTVAAALALASGLAHGQQISGTIDSSIILEAACSVEEQTGSGVDFGTLSFGTHSALFTEADAQVAGAGGISVLCSQGVTATFTLLSGLHDGEAGSAVHAMQHTSDDDAYVGYTLFTDSARTELLALNGEIELDEFEDGPQSIDLYGRAFGDPGNLPAGTYEDTLQVQLTW